MTAAVTLMPAPGVSLGMAQDAVHAAPTDEPPAQPTPSPPDQQNASSGGMTASGGATASGGGVRIRRPRRPLDVWVTLVAPGADPDHRRLLDRAPLFHSVEEAIAAQADLPRSADGSRLFARVLAHQPIELANVARDLERLPGGSELIVSVEAGHAE